MLNVDVDEGIGVRHSSDVFPGFLVDPAKILYVPFYFHFLLQSSYLVRSQATTTPKNHISRATVTETEVRLQCHDLLLVRPHAT